MTCLESEHDIQTGIYNYVYGNWTGGLEHCWRSWHDLPALTMPLAGPNGSTRNTHAYTGQ